MARSSFGKREREQAKQAKAAAKRDRRQQAAEKGADEPETPPAVESSPRSSDDIINSLAALHRDYDEGRVSYDDFQATKADLLGRLSVD